MDREDLRMIFFLLLSHHMPEKLHRTIRVGFRGRNVYFCARCTGIYSGILSVFVVSFFRFIFPTWLILPLIALLPLPSAVDWVSQSCKKRESRNTIRIVTGFLLGIGEGLVILLLLKGLFILFLQALVIVGAYILSILLIALKTKFYETYFDYQQVNPDKSG